MNHDGHLQGRCPNATTSKKAHACALVDQFVPDKDGNLRVGKFGPLTRSEAGLPPFHGCVACGLAAPDPTKEIRFYRAVGEWGFLSNLFPLMPPFELIFENQRFRSAEHAYQFGKPKDPAVAKWIGHDAPKPRHAAQAGHALDFHADVREDWNEIKFDRMRAVLLSKFTQRADLAGALLATGDKVLIEESPSDYVWGIGKRGTGKNMLGVLLMDLRAKIIAAAPTGTLGDALAILAPELEPEVSP